MAEIIAFPQQEDNKVDSTAEVPREQPDSENNRPAKGKVIPFPSDSPEQSLQTLAGPDGERSAETMSDDDKATAAIVDSWELRDGQVSDDERHYAEKIEKVFSGGEELNTFSIFSA